MSSRAVVLFKHLTRGLQQRYVIELLKLKETFIDPLLHPFSSVPLSAPTLTDQADEYYFHSESPPVESLDNLPIASRFLSTNTILRQHAQSNPSSQPPSGSRTPTIPPADAESVVSDEEEDQIGRGYAPGKNKLPVRGASSQNSPYGSNALRSLGKNLPFPSRSHHSLPPPPRPNPQASTTSLGRQSIILGYDGDRQPSALIPLGRTKKGTKESSSTMLPNSAPSSSNTGSGLPPHLLPEDLRQCLEVLEASILNGHITLSEGLKKRYEEQYPLVRSLADVFVSNVSSAVMTFDGSF